MLSVVGYGTYKKFAKKYNIPLSFVNASGKRKLKTMKRLSKQIKQYESTHKMTNGLYF
jgi:predicted transcriptional regulator